MFAGVDMSDVEKHGEGFCESNKPKRIVGAAVKFSGQGWCASGGWYGLFSVSAGSATTSRFRCQLAGIIEAFLPWKQSRIRGGIVC